jgi:hypothetical protein
MVQGLKHKNKGRKKKLGSVKWEYEKEKLYKCTEKEVKNKETEKQHYKCQKEQQDW